MNNYHKDSQLFFREVAKGVTEDLEKVQIIQLAMNLALGCERLLKGILFDINPAYILNEPSFKNSIQVLYRAKLLPGSNKSPELAQNINGDVITFKNSLLRAQLVSETTKQHKNILFAISEARDIIAHCELQLLNIEQIKEIIQRDFFTMIKEFTVELGQKPSLYFDSHSERLSKLSIAHQSNLDIKIKMLLDLHLEKWQQAKKVTGYVKKREKVTKVMIGGLNRGKTKCPACEQDAVVQFHPIIELDQMILEKIIIGYEVKKLSCFYCNLKVIEPPMLDQLGIKYDAVKNACLYCGKINDNLSGICDSCNLVTENGQIDLY